MPLHIRLVPVNGISRICRHAVAIINNVTHQKLISSAMINYSVKTVSPIRCALSILVRRVLTFFTCKYAGRGNYLCAKWFFLLFIKFIQLKIFTTFFDAWDMHFSKKELMSVKKFSSINKRRCVNGKKIIRHRWLMYRFQLFHFNVPAYLLKMKIVMIVIR